MNFPIPLLALLIAQRQGDAPQDAAKAALMAAAVRPPLAGLMIAIAMAAQAKARALPPPQSSSGGSGSGSSRRPSSPPSPPANLQKALAAYEADRQKLGEAIENLLADREQVLRRLDEIERRVQSQLGQSIWAQVAPPQKGEQFPSFLSKTKAQARAYAQALGLNEPTFVEDADTLSGVVVDQRPRPGEKWSVDCRDVTLELA